MTRPVYVVGVGMLRFGKFPEQSIKELSARAVEAALADAKLGVGELESVWFANSGWGNYGGQDCIRGQVALRPMGIDTLPIINVENACAGGSTALHGAWLSVASGSVDIALAVGAEKVFQHDRLKMFASFLGGLDVEALPELMEQARRLRAEAAKELPPVERPHPSTSKNRSEDGNGGKRHSASLARRMGGLPALLKSALVVTDHYQLDLGKLAKNALGGRSGGGGGQRSPFMDVYAIAARRHMAHYGSTQAELAEIAAKNHAHGAKNPLAQLRIEMTPQQVLADREVSYPLTRSMCAPIGDGAAAAIVCSEEVARRLGRAVKIRASVIASGRAREESDADIATRASGTAYELAGVGPEDVDLAEVHDATAFGELHQAEALGFCEEGQGGALAKSGATRIGGRIPLNTSGGLESRGHPIAASGLAQIYEIVTQLRGEAADRQVEGARIGMTQNGGGMLGVEEAAMGIHILEGMAMG